MPRKMLVLLRASLVLLLLSAVLASERGTVVQAAPLLTLSLNQTTFRPGDTLRVGLQAGNPGPGFNADFYFGYLLPDGVTAFFITSLSPLNGVAIRVDANPQTFQPLATNVLIPPGLNVALNDVFVWTFSGSEIPGTYVFFAAITPPGAFTDGRVDAGDILVIDAKSFSVPITSDSYTSACSTTVTFTFMSGVTDTQRSLIVYGAKNALDYICRKTGWGTRGFRVIASANYQDLGFPSNDYCDTSGSDGIKFNTSSPNCGEGFTVRFLTETMAHEYFHQVQQNLGFGAGPSWLIEGSAQLVAFMASDEAGLTAFPEHIDAIERTTFSKASFDLSSLEATWNPFGGYDPYGYVAAATNLLTAGAPWKLSLLMSFWANIGKGTPWRQAFQDTFGVKIEDFYTEFNQYRTAISGTFSLTYVGSPGIHTFGARPGFPPQYLFYVYGVDLFGSYTQSQLDSIIQLPSGNNGWDGPTGNVLRVYMSPTTPSGPATVTLRLPDGRQASASFQVIQVTGSAPPTPVISSISPPSLIQGGVGLKLDVMGRGFVPGSTALVDNVAVPTYVMSDSHLQMQLSGENLLTSAALVIANSSVMSSIWPLALSDPHVITAQPTSTSFSASGGTSSISVSAATNTFWGVSSTASWITINSPQTGTGNGTISYSVSPNLDATLRMGLINIGGVSIMVSQSG